jgi:hypothetical protein
MRKLLLLGLSLALACTAACGTEEPQPPATVQTPSAEAELHGTPAGGTFGEVTVAMGETVALSTSVLGGVQDRVEITVTESARDGGRITADVRILVTAGVYLASPGNFVLVGQQGTQYLARSHTFPGVLTGVSAGNSVTGSVTFEAEDAEALESATIAVYGLADDAATYAAHWEL